MDFLKWYKNIVESSREEPPADVWEEIQDELDVDMVWHELDAKLSRSKKRVMFYRMAVAASFLLLLGAGTIFIYNVFFTITPETYVLNTLELPGQDTLTPIRKGVDQQVYISSFEDKPEYLAQQEVAKKVIHKQPDTQTAIKEPEELPLPLPALEQQQYLTAHEFQTIKPMSKISPAIGQIEDPAESTTGKYYAGITGHAANTWLMNNKTMQGLKSDELTATLPSFGYNIGVVAGREINNNFTLQAEMYFISQTRQNYNEYVHGQYVSNNVQFNYTSFSLICKRSFFNSDKRSGNHYLILGAYTGVLKNAVQNLNGTSSSLKNDYSSIDYGVAGGYEYTYPFGRNLALGTGFQLKYGLKNIFSGNEYMPAYFNSTRNASINLMLSIRYNIN